MNGKLFDNDLPALRVKKKKQGSKAECKPQAFKKQHSDTIVSELTCLQWAMHPQDDIQ